MAMAPDELSAAQAAEFLGMSVLMVRRQAKNGVIPARKAGRRWVFSKIGLEEWLKRGGRQVSPDVYASPWGK
jgi:excisionase family DNA binding protein